MTFAQDTLFLGLPSFEERSSSGLRQFLLEGGLKENVRCALIKEESSQSRAQTEVWKDLCSAEMPVIDRFEVKDLWNWVWSSIDADHESFVIDVSCMPRELIGLVLFALSVRRDSITSVNILYTRPGDDPDGYATTRPGLAEEDRWLSKGVFTTRSILGYPGIFLTEGEKVLIALAGHEPERLFQLIEVVEPSILAISSEAKGTSTILGAGTVSEGVVDYLRQRIQVPQMEEVTFSANSIDDTYKSLEVKCPAYANKNLTIAAMNTKLAFVGSALYALRERRIRLTYLVPLKYNPLYSAGTQAPELYDITVYIKSAQTTQVQLSQ